MMRWRKELANGFYYQMLDNGFIKEADREPEIGPLEFYLEAFKELSSCRSVGFGIGPIPFTAIAEYSRLYDVGDFDEFHWIMRRLDDEYLILENKKTSNSGKADKNGPAKANKTNPN